MEKLLKFLYFRQMCFEDHYLALFKDKSIQKELNVSQQAVFLPDRDYAKNTCISTLSSIERLCSI